MITARSRVSAKNEAANNSPFTHMFTFIPDNPPDTEDGILSAAPFRALLDGAAAEQLEVGDLVFVTVEKVDETPPEDPPVDPPVEEAVPTP